MDTPHFFIFIFYLFIFEIGSFYNSPRVKQLSFTVFTTRGSCKMSLFPKSGVAIPLRNLISKSNFELKILGKVTF